MIGGPVSMLPENFRDGKNIQYILVILAHTFTPKVSPAGTVIMSKTKMLVCIIPVTIAERVAEQTPAGV